MVRECKNAGVDYIKLQALSQELIDRHIELEWYGKASVTPENVEQINSICEDCKISWFCTPCYPQAVDFLDPYVPFWKIRKADNKKVDLINKCLDTGKTVYISCSRLDEIPVEDKLIKPIYCIKKYPTCYGEVNFDMLKLMHGWSNHCVGLDACLKALQYDIDYLEFHLTDSLDRFHLDNKVSLTYEQMNILMYYKTLLTKQ